MVFIFYEIFYIIYYLNLLLLKFDVILTLRAQKRMNKERVFNSQIVVSLPFAVKEESSSTSFISKYNFYEPNLVI